MIKKLILSTVTACLLIACTSNDIYFSYSTLPEEIWEKDSALTFTFAVTDTAARYNIYVNIRNTSDYPYQNFWFFLYREREKRLGINGDTVFVSRQTLPGDTVECYLADQRGKWLGNGVGAAYDMSVLVESGAKFTATGIYRYRIVQAMREDRLKGIRNVGLRVEKMK